MNIKELVGRVADIKIENGHLYVYEVPDTGFFHSVLMLNAGSDALGEPSIYPNILIEMLDEGTERLTREEFRNELEMLGSEIRFELTTSKLLVRIEGLSSAFDRTMTLVGEMLSSPRLADDSFATVTSRLKSEYEDEREDTRKIAHASLTSLMFGPSHPLTVLSPDQKISQIGKATVQGLRDFYRANFRGHLSVVVVGDVRAPHVRDAVNAGLAGFDKTEKPLDPTVLSIAKNGTEHIYVPGKENVDVYFGWNTDIRVASPEYLALSVAIELLGGSGFTGHLMKTVRERDGLTYGIYARLRDTSSSYPLYAFVWGTFGNPLVGKGIRTTIEEITKWISGHITEAALRDKVSEIRGSYVVQFQDPAIIASRISTTIASGRTLEHISSYTEEIGSLSADEVRSAANKYLARDVISQASAGSVNI